MYNASSYITRCVESCYCQGLDETDFEIIVIDDGSSDNSFEVAKKISDDHSNIKIFHQENNGQGSARNLGLANASGNFIMFVDSDDFLLPNSLSPVLRRTQMFNCDISFYKMEAEKSNGDVVVNHFKQADYHKKYTGEYILLHNIVIVGSVCSALYSRVFLSKHSFRFFTDIKHEDVAFSYEVLGKAERIVFNDNCVYHYCWYPNSTDHTKNPQKRKLLIYSDLRISCLLKNLSKSNDFSLPLKKFYVSVSNSLLLSSVLSLLRHNTNFYSKKDFFLDVYHLGLLPVLGRARSHKSTLLLPFINFLALFYLLSKK